MKINISNILSYKFLKFDQNTILDLPLRNILIIAFSFLYCVWGTSWSVPIINIPYSFLWVGFVLFAAIFFHNKKLLLKDIFPLAMIGISFSFFFILGLDKNLLSENLNDFYYTLTFLIKIFLGIFLFFVFYNVFNNEKDISLFFISSSIFISLIILYLSWKYLIVYDLNYIGVIVDDSLGGLKAYKNSLATSVALLTPFIYAGIFVKSRFRVFFYIAIGSIFFLLFWINSRSSLIIIGIEFFIFYLISHSRNIKKYTRNSMVLTIVLLILSGISFSDWLYKNNAFSDGGPDQWSQDISSSSESLLESHRGWLLMEALEGYLDSSLLGNGLGTFRIRDSNQGSRTDTHNDYSLLLYEQGTIGFLLILYIIFWRIRSNLIASKKSKDLFLEASTVSLFGLLIAPIFINIMQTFIFWSILSLSFVIAGIQTKLSSKEENRQMI